MAFQEDISFFFDAVNGFAIPATWQPSWGGALKSGNVILDLPDINTSAFHQDVISADPRIQFATSDFLGLKEGEYMHVNNVKYRLHETPVMLSDGAISEARLEKVT